VEACRICGNDEGNRSFTAREMMLGLGDTFRYAECRRCGALQIEQVPAELGRYYAPPYYSFRPARPASLVRRRLRRLLAGRALAGRGAMGAVLERVLGRPPLLAGLRDAAVDPSASVLDVGAGAGQMLFLLHDYGFRRLAGIDPFLEHDLAYPNGVTVRRVGLEDVDGSWDLVTFHHSFEHVPDPAATLAAAASRLAPGGRILVRTPVAAASWRRYGEDWVELDAPRHLHVHTAGSMRVLAEGAGLEVERVQQEAYALEIWGSEQYRRGIALSDPRSHWQGGAGTVFSRREMRGFEKEALQLARQGEAGRAAFWLRRA
jgi:SAM-dependent methyltransferase